VASAGRDSRWGIEGFTANQAHEKADSKEGNEMRNRFFGPVTAAIDLEKLTINGCTNGEFPYAIENAGPARPKRGNEEATS